MTGVGTDIVDVQRLAASLRRQGAFAETVFTGEERRFCEAQPHPERHYAARFAAKEAFLKALGLGVFSGVALHEIEVVREASGRPRLRLGPSAAAALRAVGGDDALVSLSHDGDMALAFVVVP
ncbi:MAG TPA: holo-ACP synthase [Anaeromyxobacteraceae bacterium]|nr:holo-ACP synthase [Anaeromyxobacteraceae bacterium]